MNDYKERINKAFNIKDANKSVVELEKIMRELDNLFSLSEARIRRKMNKLDNSFVGVDVINELISKFEKSEEYPQTMPDRTYEHNKEYVQVQWGDFLIWQIYNSKLPLPGIHVRAFSPKEKSSPLLETKSFWYAGSLIKYSIEKMKEMLVNK